MSLKRFHYDLGHRCCYTCMYIDEYTLNIEDAGEVPHGYDGTAICCKFDDSKKETGANRLFVSPVWDPCWKYKRCTKRQADYLDIFDGKTQTIIKNPNMTKQ